MNTRRDKAGRTSLARARKVLNPTELFFFEWAGWSYNPKTESAQAGRVRCARDLAHAESIVEQLGWSYEWVEDFDANANGEYPEATEVLGCILYDRKAENQQRNKYDSPLESLWGIDDPTPQYRRVVEAELASEALSRLNAGIRH